LRESPGGDPRHRYCHLRITTTIASGIIITMFKGCSSQLEFARKSEWQYAHRANSTWPELVAVIDFSDRLGFVCFVYASVAPTGAHC